MHIRALVADDDPVTSALVARTLERWGISVTVSADGETAWRLLTSGPPPALAIVDWMMPGLDGLTVCRQIRREPTLSAMYILLLTARGAQADLVEGLDAGADDYMTKPIDPEELRVRVQVARRIATLQQRLADQVNTLQTTQDHLARLLSTDMLTQVSSRRHWFESASAELARSRRYNRDVSVLLVDLDFFKRINDTFGHAAGDAVLRRFAEMLRAECRQSDIVGRLGGEEFGVLVPDTGHEAAQLMATRIRDACRRLTVDTPLGDIRCSCSIGITERVPEDEDVESILRRADAALYHAKGTGRDGWKTYVPPSEGRSETGA
jgi:diguanylate cyclase (GGDEF)-like protein